jgi:hypothetical protein
MISAGPTEIHHRYRIEDTALEPTEVREGEVMVTGPYAVQLDLRGGVASICRRMYSHAVATEMTVMSPSTARAGRRGRKLIDVAVVGATGYAGAEAVRLLAGHPNVRLVGLVGRGREQEPIGQIHPHLGGTGLHVDAATPASDAVVFALPHGAAAAIVPDLVAEGRTIIDLGPDFRLRDPADYPRWYHFDHPAPDLLAKAVYGLPELHREALSSLADCRRGDRRRPRLLSHGDRPRAGASRARRPHRGPGRRREERRFGRRSRREARFDVLRGQREREGVWHRRPSARR